MGDLTKNIDRIELQCSCRRCDVRIQDHEPIIKVWQAACDHFAKLHNVDRVVLTVLSAARCYEYNRLPVSEGGPGSNDNSQHPRCNAMDGRIKLPTGEQIPNRNIYDYFDKKYPNRFGIGIYSWGVHADTRELKGRW